MNIFQKRTVGKKGIAAALLASAGIGGGPHDVDALVQRTEGWPAGLYLAALAMRAGSPRAEAGFSADARMASPSRV